MKPLRVLVIDDSAFNRRTISEILESNPSIQVVGKAFDGEEGLKLAAQLKPDLITLDIEMPRMDGFTFLRILMHQMPTPVIVISSHSRKDEVFQALELGALDFLAKPSHHLGPDISILKEELLAKVMTIQTLQTIPFANAAITRREILSSVATTDAKQIEIGRRDVRRVICVGASTGGPPALETLFRATPASLETAFLVAQHMPEKFTKAFAERLNRMVKMKIVEAEDGMPLTTASAFVAPGGWHMGVVDVGPAAWEIRLAKPGTEDRYIPSVDFLFSSVAEHFGSSMMAVVLTGMGADGSLGVRAVHKAGGETLAENQETCVVFGMPKEAALTGCVKEVLPMHKIVERVGAFSSGRG